MAASPKVRILQPQEGQALNVLGARVLVKLTGAARTPFLADHPVPPGYGVPPHSHRDEDESFFVLEGEVTFECDEGIAHIGPGGFVHCPRGSRHSFRNETDRPARMIVLASAGGGLHAMMQDFDRAAMALAQQKPSIGGEASALAELDPQTITTIAAQYGIHVM